MKPTQYQTKDLESLLKKQKIATLAELKKALGTAVDVTVFRKLKELSYRSSYSHRGRYYTLEKLACFDEQGLWSFHSIQFSKYGTLLATAEDFVNRSEAGYFAWELESVLNVSVKEALLKLVQRTRIARQRVSGRYLYISTESSMRKRQLLSRRIREDELSQTRGTFSETVTDQLKATIVLFMSLLDEKQRRLYAGLESLKFGHGGDCKIAALIGMNVHTVAKGRRQLLQQDLDTQRVRKKGAGRKSVEKKRHRSSRPSAN